MKAAMYSVTGGRWQGRVGREKISGGRERGEEIDGNGLYLTLAMVFPDFPYPCFPKRHFVSFLVSILPYLLSICPIYYYFPIAPLLTFAFVPLYKLVIFLCSHSE